MTILDQLIVAAFSCYIVAVGLRDRRLAATSLEQYFLAGRPLNGWQAGISMAATQFAADTPLLVTGLVAAGGIFALWRLWVYAVSFLLLAFVFAACWRRAGVLTDAELAELRYRGGGAAPLRLIKALYFGTVFNCFALAIVLLAATRIAEPFLPWDEWLAPEVFDPLRRFVEWAQLPLTAIPAGDPARWAKAAGNLISLLLIALITLFYSTLGGLRSVVKTDMVQFAIMMLGSIVYAAFVVQETGGLDSMLARLRATFESSSGGLGLAASELLAFTPSVARDVTAMLLAVFLLQWLIQVNADGTGYLAQRTMACRNDHEARRAATIFTFAQVLVRSLVWLPIALGLLLLFPPDTVPGSASYVAEREATFVRGIEKFLPAGFKGLMLTGMIAALASTVDSHLNWGASYWTNDIYRRFICGYLGRTPSARSQVWVARLSNVIILGVSLLIMSRLDSIKTAWESSLLLGAGVGIMLVLRWLWWRITAWGELAALIASALLVPLVLVLISDDSAPLRMLIVAAVATAAGVCASLWIDSVRPEALCGFYKRVQPPGWWAPVARAAGDDPRAPSARLARGVAATALSAVSVFCLLIGIGPWLVEATPPAWLPQREVWVAFNLVVGLAVVPLWLRLGLRQPAPAPRPLESKE